MQAQNIIHVDPNATGNNDGSSWTDAYTDFDQALQGGIAGLNEYWLTGDTFLVVSSSGFRMTHDSIEIYGGFAGTETMRSQRDWRANETVLDGNMGSKSDPMDNSTSVIYAEGASNNSQDHVVIDGITVTGGTAGGTTQTKTGSGGGIAISEYVDNVTIRNCRITGNMAKRGGGIWCYAEWHSINLLIENCRIDNNEAMEFGGAFQLIARDGQTLNADIVGCLIDNNVAGQYACVAHMFTWLHGATLNVNVVNSTIVDNNQPSAAEVITISSLVNSGQVSSETLIFQNTIIRSNTGDQIDHTGNVEDPDSVALFNCIKEMVGMANWVHESNTNAVDPMFTDKQNGDYTLATGSPAIDMGSTSGINVTLPSVDLEGNARIRGASVDIGAYEAESTGSSLVEELASTMVYPNPATDFVKVQSDARIVSLKLFSLHGQNLRTVKTNQMLITDLHPGAYFLVIETTDGTVSSQILKK